MKTKLLNVVIPIAGLALLAAGCHGKKQEQAARPPSPVNVAKTELAECAGFAVFLWEVARAE